MNQQRLELLYTAYFLSQDNLGKGAVANLVRRIIGIKKDVFSLFVRELIVEEYLTMESSVDGNLVLSQKAVTLLSQQLTLSRVLILQITNPQFLPPASRLVFGYRYNYYFSENGKIIQEGTVAVLASDILSMAWGLGFDDINSNTVLLLLLFAKDYLVKAFNERKLNSNERVELMTNNQPSKPPYNPEDFLPLEDAKFVVLSNIVDTTSSNLTKVVADVTAEIDQLIKYNRDLEWYTNAENIPNQKLVLSIVDFIRQHRSGLVDPLDFLNLLYKQVDDLKSFLEHPDDYLRILKTLPISEELRYTLFGMILKWHGGYPVNNLNPRYNAILQEIEREFLSMEPTANAPEKDFCKLDEVMEKRMRDMEKLLNRQLGNPAEDTMEEEETVESNNPTPKKATMDDEKQASLASFFEPEEIQAFSSNITYSALGVITPVMGVTGLAADYSKVLSTMQAETGQMIGIFGKWGRGKTFFLKQLSQHLKISKKPIFLQVDFHAWKYQETPASWAYLYEQFVDGYLRKKIWWWPFGYYWRLVCLNIKRNGIYPILFFGGIVTVTTMSFFYPIDKWYLKTGAVSGAIVVAAALLAKLKKEYSAKAISLIRKYHLRNSFKSSLGIQADIQDELIKLLKVWIPRRKCGKKRIVLVVEDIDRCNEDKIIQNIDALRVLLEDAEIAKRVLIIAAIDERILKNAILIKYRDVLETKQAFAEKIDNIHCSEHHDLISEYLDKLFISAIKLGNLSDIQVKEYMLQLIKNEMYDDDGADSLQSDREITATTDVAMSFVSNFNLTAPNVSNRLMESKDAAPLLQRDKVTILTKVEVSCLEDFFENWTNPTPRKMRIFYYRYLLSKNQLIGKYDALNRINIWQLRSGISTIMDLILFYSQAGNLELLTMDRRQTRQNPNDTVSIPNIPDSQTVPRMDLLNLLEVLELTIAY